MNLTYLALATALAVLPAGTPDQQDAPRTITVTALGEVTTSASHLALWTEWDAEGGSASEVLTDLAQLEARSRGGLEDSGVDGLELRSAELELGTGPEDPNGGQTAWAAGVGVVVMDVAIGDEGEPEEEAVVRGHERLELRLARSEEAVDERARIVRLMDTLHDLELEPQAPPATSESGRNGSGSRITIPSFPGQTQGTDGLVLGTLDPASQADADRRAQAAALKRARVLAEGLARMAGGDLGDVHTITQLSLGSAWEGLGSGVQTLCQLQVTFTLN